VTFAKFNMVGLLGASLQLLLLSLFNRSSHLPLYAITPLAVELVLLHNFALHEAFTWRDRGAASTHSKMARLRRFHLGNGAISLIGNTALTYLFVQRFKAAAIPSSIASMAVCALANFVVADRWVYGKPPSLAHSPR
jgi:putative flippase GtrA